MQYETGALLKNRGDRVQDRQAILEERRKERIKNALLTQLGPNVSPPPNKVTTHACSIKM
jgi:hypothetical protein